MKVVPRKSPFIRQFSGPGHNGIVCFRFWQAIVASGCPGACAYCFLQTQYPYRRGQYELSGTMFENLEQMVPQALRWLRRATPAGLIIGENQDGLAFERPYKKLLGVTPLELLIPLFDERNPVGHTLIVLSKFTTTEYAEVLGPSRHVVFSWSLSLPSISERYESGVAPLAARLARATSMRGAGYRIRFRLDALAPVPRWQEDLEEIVASINQVRPEMLTLGGLRASNPTALRRAAISNGRDDSIFDYISAQDPSGFKYRTAARFHIQAFKQVKELLDPSIKLALCKEHRTTWQAVGASWKGCHCLHGHRDRVAVEGMRRRRTASAGAVTAM